MLTRWRILIRRLAERIGALLIAGAPWIYRSPSETATARRWVRQRKWYIDDGDRTLRLNYPLGSDAVIWDVGGYDGRWAGEALCKFGARIEIFEPVSEFLSRIRDRFEHNPRVRVHDYGLASRDREELITLDEGGSSTVIAGPDVTAHERIQLRAASAVFEELGRGAIDLMKINIEGGEYELLEHLLDEGLVARVRYLQIQFHEEAPNAATRMAAIQERLKATHILEWSYPWVWESWSRRH